MNLSLIIVLNEQQESLRLWLSSEFLGASVGIPVLCAITPRFMVIPSKSLEVQSHACKLLRRLWLSTAFQDIWHLSDASQL